MKLFLALILAFCESPAQDLDSVAKRIIAQERVVGASVLVARGDRIVFQRGYGFADIGLEAPAKSDTAYRVVGPMMPFTGMTIMQLVERGKLSLDDDIAKYVPEFPLQGHKVTVRNLLNHTSGIVDYHYLGDPIEATSRQPKALDEVMALYATKRWVNEPGEKWDWSISGFQLLVTILERVTGQSYEDYVRRNLFDPAGVKSTTYADNFTLVRGLAHGYRRAGESYALAHEDGMAYNTDLRYTSTVEDLFRIWRAVQHKLSAATWNAMTTAEGAAIHMRAEDPLMRYGLALTLNHEDDHRSVGQHGSLLGYSGSLYEFPKDGLTIVVLTNTEGQNAYAISRALARAVLGLPELPKPPEARPQVKWVDQPVTAAEIQQLSGTYLLKAGKVPANLHDSYAQFRRTYRVFNENGRLMIQALGQGPERLLKQAEGGFAMKSSGRIRITFTAAGGNHRALSMSMDSPGGLPLAGERVGDSDPQTFHQQLQ